MWRQSSLINIQSRQSAPPVHVNVTDFHCKDRKNSQKLTVNQHKHFIILGQKGISKKLDKDRELEEAKIAAQEKDKAIQLARIVDKEKDREIELAKIAAEEKVEMARIESIERQAEKNWEMKLSESESDKDLKVTTEVEFEKLKYSFEMQHQELMNQLKLQKANLLIRMRTDAMSEINECTIAVALTTYFFLKHTTSQKKWTAPSEFGTYCLCEQRRFRRACASAQSRQNLRWLAHTSSE